MTSPTSRARPHPALVFAGIFAGIFLLHLPLLQLPYFWDEAGYYVPAARDLLLTGSLIPHTTISNAHPPLVMAWIALWWKCVGFAPLVTRSAMVMVAAFSLLGVFRLAQRVANTQVAIASTLCTALYPVFFAQSSLAQVDLAAAGLIFWGLCAYVDDRPVAVAVWFSLAALAKETAILAPMALGMLGSVTFRCAAAIRIVLLDDLCRDSRHRLSSRAKLDGSVAPNSAAVDSTPAAGTLVHLSLFPHRICLRQSGILPLQRRVNAQSDTLPAGAAAAAVAGVRLHAFVAADAGHVAGDAAASRQGRRRRAQPHRDSSANDFSRRREGVRGRHGIDRWSGAGAIHVAGSAAGDHCGSLDAAQAAASLDSGCSLGRSCIHRSRGSGIRPMDSRRKTISRTAITSFCTRTASAFSRPGIQWRMRSRRGRPRTNFRARGSDM